MMMFTAKQKADEARREVGYRQFVYSKKVGEGKMTKKDAERRIAIMQEISDDYAVQAEKEEAAGRLL